MSQSLRFRKPTQFSDSTLSLFLSLCPYLCYPPPPPHTHTCGSDINSQQLLQLHVRLPAIVAFTMRLADSSPLELWGPCLNTFFYKLPWSCNFIAIEKSLRQPVTSKKKMWIQSFHEEIPSEKSVTRWFCFWVNTTERKLRWVLCWCPRGVLGWCGIVGPPSGVTLHWRKRSYVWLCGALNESVCMAPPVCSCPRRPEEAVCLVLCDGFIGGCESPEVDAGSWSWGLCKRNLHSKFLSYFFHLS